MKIQTNLKRFVLAILGMSLLGVGLTGGVVLADPIVIPSGAHVEAGAGLESVECAWMLPDMDSSAPGIQYQSEPGLHDHDADMVSDLGGDLPSTWPDYACDLAEDTDSGWPAQPDGVHHMITVQPNAEDSPEEVRVQLWASVDDAHGIDALDDVYWKIFHPDGSFKVQVHANADYNGGVVRAIGDDTSACTDWGDPNIADTMYHAASATGQVSPSAVDDINNGLIALCQQQVKALYYSEFQISKHQPCGEYKIETHAVANGAESVLTSYIDVVCFWDLAIDFTNVDWGALQPGTDKTVAGDLVFGTANRPTVKNRGNAGMWVGVQFDPLVQQDVPGPKTIDSFDAAFGLAPSTLLHFDPIPAGVIAWFDDDPSTTPGDGVGDGDQLLCSNELGKLDLSIHPPSTMPAGTYLGHVTVWAKTATPGSLPGDIWWDECLDRFYDRTDRIIDADGIASPSDGLPAALDPGLTKGAALSDFPAPGNPGSGLDWFDNDHNGQWTWGPNGDDLHSEDPGTCSTAVRDGVHQLGRDCKVLDWNGSLFDGQPVDCDLEVNAPFTEPHLTNGGCDSSINNIRYFDANDNGWYDNGEDIVLDLNGNGVYD